MSERSDVPGTPPAGRPRRPRLLVVLAVFLFAEAAAVGAAAVVLLVELLAETPASYASAVAILVLTALAAVWLAVVARGALHGRSWVRAAAMVWQVLQLGLGIGSLQGLFHRDDVGWLLIVPALIVMALLFTRQVIAATRHDPQQ